MIHEIKSQEELDALGPVIEGYVFIEINGGNLSFGKVREINRGVEFINSKIEHLDFGKTNICWWARYDSYATIKQISVIGSTHDGIKIGKPTQQELDFLRILPLDMLDMRTYQSDNNWKKCKTLPELYECHTMFCMAGFAQAYFGLEDRSLLEMEPEEAAQKAIPNLSYMFRMNDHLAKQEIKKLLK